MISAIQEFFRTRVSPEQSPEQQQRGLQLATAALLFEMLRADHDENPQERRTLEAALQKCFRLDRDETRELVRLADTASTQAVSLFPFTEQINRDFSPHQKVQVIEMLWQVAYADGRLDPYEEALVRKIADLIHVAHRDFIQAKLRARDVSAK